MGYTKTFSKTTGEVVETTDLSTECNNLEAEFHNQTGHAHDGTSAEGPVIGLIGDAGVVSPSNKVVVDTTNNRISVYVDVSSVAVEQVRIEDGVVQPVTDSDIDLGTTTERFKDGYIDTLTITTSASIGGSNILVASDIGSTVQGYDVNTAKLNATANFTAGLFDGGNAVLDVANIGVTVQGYDVDTAKYDDTTANFTGVLQNAGSNVVVDSDIGSTVASLGANTFTNIQTHSYEAPMLILSETAGTGNAHIYFKDNSTVRSLLVWTRSGDTFNIVHYDTDGSTPRCNLAFYETGNIDVVTGTFTIGGISAATTSSTWATSAITSGTFADARIAASNVTQHQASLSITESQISNLGNTIVLDSDIGSTVQAYNANYAVKNAACNFTSTLQKNGVDVATTEDVFSGTRFSAYVNTSTAMGSGVTIINTTNIASLTTDFDTDTFFTASSGVFQPDVAGYYDVKFLAKGTSIGASDYLASYIYKNGDIYSALTSEPDSSNKSENFHSVLVYLNGTTDYIEWGVYSTDTSWTLTGLSGVNRSTYIQAVKV